MHCASTSFSEMSNADAGEMMTIGHMLAAMRG